MNVHIRVLEASDAEAYRHVRLQALRTDPEAFGSTYEKEAGVPPESIIERIRPAQNRFTLGAFLDNGALAAIVTFVRETGTKTEHKGNVFGMYVSPESRGRGAGKAIMTELLRMAKKLEGVEQINLTVVSDNVPAKRLYESLGFKRFGVERNALKYGGRYFDEDWMAYRLEPLTEEEIFDHHQHGRDSRSHQRPGGNPF
ncbi:GNAT family N-acetyltransferase [Paenibacillus antri]|uniref:GNAT family N-acetyltransferase n=1 Tax=Paenibacillus antri TaxID=2582848 RepID=A0A5R9G322_9BACL|nr:GNAT family protein [Paenibacillus antri]TLS50747.1 GNAT family N-acetyltransferase [Paenibacillus antri]